MRYFDLYPEYGRGGSGEMFQICELTEAGQDVTHLVDQGIHFSTTREVERYLAKVFGGDPGDYSVDLTE